ncbi:hypothetical protein OAQ71_00895 [bacterium]|nr:hypothetical protein [bacterium]
MGSAGGRLDPTSADNPTVMAFWIFYFGVMAGCIWAVNAAYDAGWIIGLPIAIMIGITREAFFED